MDTSLPVAATLKIKVQIFCGEMIAMGPGKADLLDWRPSPADVDFVIDSLRRIVEQLV